MNNFLFGFFFGVSSAFAAYILRAKIKAKAESEIAKVESKLSGK